MNSYVVVNHEAFACFGPDALVACGDYGTPTVDIGMGLRQTSRPSPRWGRCGIWTSAPAPASRTWAPSRASGGCDYGDDKPYVVENGSPERLHASGAWVRGPNHSCPIELGPLVLLYFRSFPIYVSYTSIVLCRAYTRLAANVAQEHYVGLVTFVEGAL